jgi:protein O-mannosyl-transferase
VQPNLGSQSRTQSGARPQAHHAILFALLIVIVTVAVYSPVNRFDFADVDDAAYIAHNPHIRYGLNWDGVKWAFTEYYSSNWHPLTWLSHGLDCQLYRLNAGRHHDVNVMLHGLDAVLLYWVLLSATGYIGRSAMVALLFALHPINVESVVWIAERKNVLSMLFLLLALGAYRWFAMNPRIGRYLVVVLLFALGLMAKPQVITLPFVLLLWDYWPLQRMFAETGDTAAEGIPSAFAIPPRKLFWLILEKLPLLALSAGSAVLTLKAQRAGGAINPLNSYGLSMRAENAVVAYARYMGKAVWPLHLSAFYPYPRSGVSTWQVIASSVLLIAVTVFVIVARQRRYLLVGWLWFLGTLVPMIGVVQAGDQSIADRYAYLPFVGLFIMVCWGGADLASEKIKSRAGTAVWSAAPSLAIVLALTVMTHRQIGYWKNSITLWSHAVQVTSGNDTAETYLGEALLRQANAEAAIPHFHRAIAIFPVGAEAYLFLGYAELQVGDPRAAIEQYQRALDLTQNYGAATANFRSFTLESMASAYRAVGDHARAEQCSREALGAMLEAAQSGY